MTTEVKYYEKVYEDGEPCWRKDACLCRVTKPCKACGRLEAKGRVVLQMQKLIH